jgi:hypothetical protein
MDLARCGDEEPLQDISVHDCVTVFERESS